MKRRHVLGMVGVALLAMAGVRADAGDGNSRAASACCCGDACCCGPACKLACCCGPDCCGATCCCDTGKATKAESCCAKGGKSSKSVKAFCCVKPSTPKAAVVR